jgi:pimeloyl-ACP methyl ester carboxylesterase
MTDAILPRRETGDAADPRPPVVFLHGLAGDRLAWEGLQDRRGKGGAVDGARTRDPRRDRPVL